MTQKGFAPVLIIILIIVSSSPILFIPIPYYEQGGRFCTAGPFPQQCSQRGWHFGPSLWNLIVSRFAPQQGSAGGSQITPSPAPPKESVACTRDVKACPDGTSVSRVPPSCEFTPCLISLQEVDEAKRLALADPKVKEKLRAAGVAENELIITHLFTRTLPGGETCRCVYLFFNTKGAVLPIEPIVDLTTKEIRFK